MKGSMMGRDDVEGCRRDDGEDEKGERCRIGTKKKNNVEGRRTWVY